MPMANQSVKVRLGDYGFNLTQVPDFINFGLHEQMNVHKLVGGARVIDMVGDDPTDFTWSGTWLGPDSSDLANDLYSLMQEKKLLPLSFGSINRDVVISHLEFNYKRAYWIDYKIACVVVEQPATIGFLAGGATGFDANAALAADKQINNANDAPNLTPNDAGNNLLNGTNGLNQVLGAAGVNIGNPIAFG